VGVKSRGLAIVAITIVAPNSAPGETLRWNCSYSRMATPSGVANEKFALEFALDTVTGKAVIIGNAGMSDVDAVSGNQGLTLQEKLGSGAVQTTTIAKDGSSVHSRHTKLTPSQYYCSCR
jgi:hypothetical protein